MKKDYIHGLKEALVLVGDERIALGYQTTGQYRSALIKELARRINLNQNGKKEP